MIQRTAKESIITLILYAQLYCLDKVNRHFMVKNRIPAMLIEYFELELELGLELGLEFGFVQLEFVLPVSV